MLKFSKDSNYFIIKEEIHGFNTTKIKIVYYTKDIHWKKIDTDPWRKTTMAEREWFNKHYRHKFKENYNG